MKFIVGIYIRLPEAEIVRLCNSPQILPKYDPRVALADGRAVDLGRAWEPIGCFVDGGVRVPSAGPAVGDEPIDTSDERATWSYVVPDRVKKLAELLHAIGEKEFRRRYEADLEDTQDSHPGERTEGGDRVDYMYRKLRLLAEHYSAAAARGEAMLVRIGERM